MRLADGDLKSLALVACLSPCDKALNYQHDPNPSHLARMNALQVTGLRFGIILTKASW